MNVASHNDIEKLRHHHTLRQTHTHFETHFWVALNTKQLLKPFRHCCCFQTEKERGKDAEPVSRFISSSGYVPNWANCSTNRNMYTRKHKAFKCNLSSVISFGSLSPCYTGCIHCLSLPFALGHVLPSSCVLPSRVLGLEEFLVIYFCFWPVLFFIVFL